VSSLLGVPIHSFLLYSLAAVMGFFSFLRSR
jgi:hypothetical protein